MVENNEKIKHATLGYGSFRNFSGVKTAFNKMGNREFSIFLPRATADLLSEIGWYVKTKPPKREGQDVRYQLDIRVSYEKNPPVIKLYSADGECTILNEDTVGLLDSADIADATVEIRPYNWDVDGKKGCKAYLNAMDVKIRPPRRTLNGRLDYDDEEDVPF